MSLIERLRRRLFPTRWERFGRAVERAWAKGIGIEQAAFDLARARREDLYDELVEEAMEWLDHAVFTSRTPYGLDVFSLQMALVDEVGPRGVRPKRPFIKRLGIFSQSDYRMSRREIAESLWREIEGATTAGCLVLTLLKAGDAADAVLSSLG